MNLNRRHALGLGVAVPFVAACGSGSSETSATPTRTANTPIAATSEVAVGSATIFKDERVVVTQPTAGEFKAFDATCTHRKCLVSRIDGDEIVCTCHFSKFSIADGSVIDGPANTPLASIPVTVTNGEIFFS